MDLNRKVNIRVKESGGYQVYTAIPIDFYFDGKYWNVIVSNIKSSMEKEFRLNDIVSWW